MPSLLGQRSTETLPSGANETDFLLVVDIKLFQEINHFILKLHNSVEMEIR